jgi:carboxyl-terminal processing protease|tara:strand:- start:4936 stop:6096 length:1161 start_codon:yes stop_codon:yes gene_type:complete
MRTRTLLLGGLLAFIAGIAANQQFGIRTAPIDSFERAVQQIIEHYIVEPDRDGLERAAINGMVGTLDDYSELLSPEAYQRLLTNAEGTFAGIGIEIGLRQDLFTVLRIIPQSPAAASVVQVGDRIKAVDGNTMQGLLLTEVIDKLRGPAGSRVNLVLSRAQRARHTNGEPVVIDIELTLVRQTLDGAYLDIRLTENNVAYVRATQCYDAMASDIQRAISTVSEAPLKGIILDLRSNPGGTLTCAVGTVDLFLTSGTVVTIQDNRTPEDQAPSRAFTATSDTPFPELPLAILVNGSTASAAEIIAGALQDHGRATILGSQTFAKGTVQTLLPPLPNGSALKITTARYLTPLGRSFDQEGLVPDKLVENDDNGAIAAAVSALTALQTD